MGKYNNTRVEVDGMTFDSKAEAARYQELKLLQAAGRIQALQCQPVYTLVAPFKYNGKRERAVTYVADFTYQEIVDRCAVTIVEDVKGVRTEMYKLKRKLLLSQQPHIVFREIDANDYHSRK